ncbi:hypothetical protein [Thermomonas flagellata]|uniref:hypothetical protein n=1 Tax=Thermomonas flagellata TaxID=2888524 RepID=UPI001F04B605|nr:hypothetical protein [Thermomonas flagellata]
MFERTVFLRTAAGEAALAQHDHRLSLALRRVLILVDGRSDGAALRARAPYRDLDESLERLLAEGLIAIAGAAPAVPAPAAAPAPAAVTSGAQAGPAGPAGPAALRQALFDLCREVLGDAQAEAAGRRLLTAGDTPGEIAAALAKTVSVVRLTVDEAKADTLRRRGEALLRG